MAVRCLNNKCGRHDLKERHGCQSWNTMKHQQCGFKDSYDYGYSYADDMMKNDCKTAAIVDKLNDDDWGTIRDRIADAYVAGVMVVWSRGG